MAFCTLNSQARAAIILSVDFDPLTPGIQSERGVATGETFSADVVMNLTEASTLSAYQFSVQFDRNEIEFVSRSETAPPGFGFFETDSSNVNNLANGLLYRFGADSGAGPVAPAGPFVVASLTFRGLAPSGSPTDIDVRPGKFETGLDDFLANGTFLPIPDSQLVFNGGSVTASAAIPEPTSLGLALGCSVLASFVFRRRFGRSC
jgi:hypothetical protein